LGDADSLVVHYLLTSTDLGYSGSGLLGVLTGTPDFVDAENGDYHQQVTSPGIDFAPAAGGVDLEFQPRTVDLPDVPNNAGPLDLGPYEHALDLGCAGNDTIYCNGFDAD
jgi:hypothetical protein